MTTLGWLLCSGDEVPDGDAWLSPHERDRQAGMRVLKRRLDFRAGRWTAKQALRAMMAHASGGPARPPIASVPEADDIDVPVGSGAVPDLCDIDIRAADDGAPEVFFPSGPAPWAVSIAHSGGRALAVVGAPGVPFGADLETIELRSEAFVEDYFLAYEKRWIASHPEASRPTATTLLWSVKESVLKALREGLREDTRAVETLAGGALFTEHPTSTWRPVGALVRRGLIPYEGFAMEREGQILTLLARDTAPTLLALAR